MAETVDRMTSELRRLAESVESRSGDDLAAIVSDAAKDYGSYALWPTLPADQQGSRDAVARQIREDRRDAAAALWLAAKNEQHRRRRGPAAGGRYE